MKEFDDLINNLLHRVMRIIDNIERDRREYNGSCKKEINALLMARQEILNLVALKAKENIKFNGIRIYSRR